MVLPLSSHWLSIMRRKLLLIATSLKSLLVCYEGGKCARYGLVWRLLKLFELVLDCPQGLRVQLGQVYSLGSGQFCQLGKLHFDILCAA